MFLHLIKKNYIGSKSLSNVKMTDSNFYILYVQYPNLMKSKRKDFWNKSNAEFKLNENLIFIWFKSGLNREQLL